MALGTHCSPCLLLLSFTSRYADRAAQIKNTVKLNLDKASQQNLYLRNLLDVCLRELQRLYAEGSNIEHPLLRNKLGIAGVEGDADQGSPSKRMKLALTAAGQESKAEGASSSDVVITKNVQEGWKAVCSPPKRYEAACKHLRCAFPPYSCWR